MKSNVYFWVSREDRLPTENDGKRILIFSPVYAKGHEMRYRIVDQQFFRICKEATHWLSLESIDPEVNRAFE